MFRVAADQLKLRGGLVRCGACQHVFDAIGALNYVDDATLPAAAAGSAAVGDVIAAIRRAETVASKAMSQHGDGGDAAPADDPAVAVATRPPSFPAATVSIPPAAATMATADDTDPDAQPVPAESAALPAAMPTARLADDAGSAPSGASSPPAAARTSAAAGIETSETAPAFLREERPKRRGLLYLAGAFFLVLLLAQLAVLLRADVLARYPQARPLLGELCRVFRCTVGWPARGDMLAVVGTELQSLPGTSAFELTAVVRNRGSVTLALPAIELTLTDTLNRPVVRKVFAADAYLAGEADARQRLEAGLAAGADLTVRIAFEARGVNAAGFVVYPFYL
jgi:predicted Zn finger-like uncharacterized protein